MFRDQYCLVSKQEPIRILDMYREMLFDRRDTGIEVCSGSIYRYMLI